MSINLEQGARLVQAIMGAVAAGTVAVQHAKALFAEAGIPDEQLRAMDADYDRRIAEAERRAAGQ
ncbi:MAG: hypothetical protein AB7H88_21610 [Vicinamibacterales bacterium]